MPHLSLALARKPGPSHYRTNSEIHQDHIANRTVWRKHRWFSLLAQLLSPLCTLFSLPALTEHWYIQKGANGAVEQTKPDPPLIIAAGVFCLSLSVFANVSILLRLLDVHCRLFTTTTLGFLSVHVLLAVISCTIFGVEHAHPDGYILSTAFWLTVVAASIAFAVMVSLTIDGFRTKWYIEGGTGLTGEQRSLVVVFNGFVLTILIGSVAFRYLLDDATFLDSIYFVIQCAITTGFGDEAPTSVGGRAFLIAFMSFAILWFAVLVAFVRSTALETLKNHWQDREQTILERVKTKRSVVLEHHSRFTALLMLMSCGLYHPKHSKEVNASETKDTQSSEQTRVEEDKGKRGRKARKKRTKYAYEEKIEELQLEQSREFRSQLLTTTFLVILVWLLGALAFMYLEGWSYWIAFYFTFIAISTIGLGDFTPVTPAGRAFFCFWALVGAGILTVFFSILADGYSSHFKETFQRNFISHWMHTFRRKRADVLDEPNPDQKPPTNEHHHHRHHHGKHRNRHHPKHELSTISPDPESPPTSSKGVEIEIVENDEDLPADEIDESEEEEEEEGEDDRKSRLLMLIGDTKDHLDQLVTHDRGDAKAVDIVVRRVMDEEDFERKNRERVESDRGLKEFIYLRNLQDKFLEVEALAKLVLSIETEDSDVNSSNSKSPLAPNRRPSNKSQAKRQSSRTVLTTRTDRGSIRIVEGEKKERKRKESVSGKEEEREGTKEKEP